MGSSCKDDKFNIVININYYAQFEFTLNLFSILFLGNKALCSRLKQQEKQLLKLFDREVYEDSSEDGVCSEADSTSSEDRQIYESESEYYFLMK